MKPLSRHLRFETPELNDVQLRIVDSLRQDGVAVATFRQLLGDSQWAELEADIAPFARRTEETLRDEPEKLAQKRKYLVGDEPEKLAHEKKYYLVTRFWSKKQNE